MLLVSQAQLELFRAAALAWIAILIPAPQDEDVQTHDTNSSLIAKVWVYSETQRDEVVSRLSDDRLVGVIDEAVSGLVLSTPVTRTWQIVMPSHPPSSPPTVYPSPSSPSAPFLYYPGGSSPAAPPQISPRLGSPPPQSPVSELSLDSESNTISGGWILPAAVASVSMVFAMAALIIYRRLRWNVGQPKRIASLACSNASTTTPPQIASDEPMYVVTGTQEQVAPVELSRKNMSAEQRQSRAFATCKRSPAAEPPSGGVERGLKYLFRQRPANDDAGNDIPESKTQTMPETKPIWRASAATAVLLQRMQSDSQTTVETAVGRLSHNGSVVKLAALRHIEQAMHSVDSDEADSPHGFKKEDLAEMDALDETSLQI